MKIQVESFVYESMRKLDTVCLPDIYGMYTVSDDGSIREKFAHIEHNGDEWVWVPHEMGQFKVHPLKIKFKIFNE